MRVLSNTMDFYLVSWYNVTVCVIYVVSEGYSIIRMMFYCYILWPWITLQRLFTCCIYVERWDGLEQLVKIYYERLNF